MSQSIEAFAEEAKRSFSHNQMFASVTHETNGSQKIWETLLSQYWRILHQFSAVPFKACLSCSRNSHQKTYISRHPIRRIGSRHGFSSPMKWPISKWLRQQDLRKQIWWRRRFFLRTSPTPHALLFVQKIHMKRVLGHFWRQRLWTLSLFQNLSQILSRFHTPRSSLAWPSHSTRAEPQWNVYKVFFFESTGDLDSIEIMAAARSCVSSWEGFFRSLSHRFPK